MKFFIETDLLTGSTDMMDVQAIGTQGDGRFVVEAGAKDDALEKLRAMFEDRVLGAHIIRPATDDEAEEFAEWQRDAIHCSEFARQLHEEYGKGLANEQPDQA